MAITYPNNPVLTDQFIVEFNTAIQVELSWLNNPLGKVQTVTKKHGNSLVKFPAIHEDSGEYTEVFPNDKTTNFSWFVFEPMTDFSSIPKSKIKTTCDFNIFIDLNKVYPDVSDSRNLENAKLEVINALSSLSLKSGALRITEISDDYEDVYQGFNLKGIADNYFMQPYGGLNVKMDVYIKNNICTPDEVSEFTEDTVFTNETEFVS